MTGIRGETTEPNPMQVLARLIVRAIVEAFAFGVALGLLLAVVLAELGWLP